MKKCSTCKNSKPTTEFGKCGRAKDGLQPRCRDCTKVHSDNYLHRNPHIRQRIKERCRRWYLAHQDLAKQRARENELANKDRTRDRKLRKAYGIGLSDYSALLKKQRGRCAICDKRKSQRCKFGGRAKLLHVDHCHETGVVRGLLCPRCNTMVSFFERNHALAEKALVYLRKAK